ncbi:MAG: hypothetical protein H7Y28_05330 [Rhodoferax sp.]|nr:hypothetical protein [Rhodoferax sp.]
MNKSISILLATGLLGVSLGAIAQGSIVKSPTSNDQSAADMDQPMAITAKAMDANGDGMISRDEFTKYHGDVYKGMHPNADGMVDIRPATKMQRRMMMGGKPMAIDSTMMGARSDGMVTRAQYMKYHDDMYNGMQMNKQNMVDAKTMMLK